MKLTISRSDIWGSAVEDRPGGLAAKLRVLAEAGAHLELVMARRAPENSGTGVVLVTPLQGAAVMKAARQAEFAKTHSLHSVRVEGPDKPGLGALLATRLGEEGVNLRGMSAAAVGKRFVMYIAVDDPADAAKVIRILKRL